MIDSKSMTGILGEIRQPTNLERQINALKLLKHDIIGNQLRKEAWRSSGVLALLADILSSPSVSSATWRGEEGKVILHAVTIVGSLVHGEPDCIEPMEASHMFVGLVRALDAVNVNTSIVVAALRALNNIADALPRRITGSECQAFIAAIYSDDGQQSLDRVIAQNNEGSANYRQNILAARLLAKTCNTEPRRSQAASSGCLEALALTTARQAAHGRGHRSRPPSISFVLRAVATIISGSSDRAYQYARFFLHHYKAKGGQMRRPSRDSGWMWHQAVNNPYSEGQPKAGNPMLEWLLYLARTESGSTRLMAIWIVTLFLEVFHQDAESDGIAAFMVPLLVQMLDQTLTIAPSDLYPEDERQLMADAPRVLALLIHDDPGLQEAAFEAGAVGKLARLMRKASEAVPKDRSKAFWSPQKVLPPDYSTTLPQALCEQWLFRESVLQALAAIASQNDDYRRAVVETGAVVPVVECLKPLDVQMLTEQQRQTAEGAAIRGVGNPVDVLLAACEAAKALSRSVSTLRTSLVDANLAGPLVALLKHSHIDVKIAATAVICNIVLEFSPMRQAAVDSGVIRLLCQQAHSADARLKLNSLWALKHVVHSAPNSLKLQIMSELGSGWLTQALETTTGAPVLPSIAALTGGAPSLFPQYEDDEVHMIDTPTDVMDDDAIREQALDFIRNLIAGNESQEMVEYLLKEVGHDKLFDMLTSLLALCNNSNVTLAALCIVTNISASVPVHRQILVSHGRLLSQILPLFEHDRQDIRVTLAWLVSNLTWPEDNEDRLSCKARAHELRKAGVMQRLEMMNEDEDLDVRERVRVAMHQMHEALP